MNFYIIVILLFQINSSNWIEFNKFPGVAERVGYISSVYEIILLVPSKSLEAENVNTVNKENIIYVYCSIFY